ncbi:MAG TPA: TlpA disulfide reductase family protein [Rhizomicrobium sp.]|jgi:thiol-disulfide isomerase/thioredoxin|nr:TlpA disulfide reductase family protein [Rhizomicrobium sp.]
MAIALLTGCSPHGATHKQRRPDSLAKLKLETAKSVPAVTFTDVGGHIHRLTEFRGQYVLLNLWATWCAPCVRELPSLSRLQAAIGRKTVNIVPVNVGKGTALETAEFLKSNKANLPVYLDTKSAFLHTFGAFGLPLTVLIDPQGREIARASGAVAWDAKDSISYFKALKRAPLN